MFVKKLITLAASLAAVSFGALASADTIVFKNGDRLTGTVLEMTDGKIKFKPAAIGAEVLIDSVDISTFSTDGLIDLQLADGTIVKQKVDAAGDGRVSFTGAAGAQEVGLTDLKSINPRTGWKGNIRGGFIINRGNTDNESFNAGFDLWRRSEQDRYKFGGQYSLTNSEDSEGDKSATTDNWTVFGQYDYFFNEKLYGYGRVQVDHDRIAELQYRITPGVGLGYQWHEDAVWNFNTEGGVAYVYEKYEEPDDATPDFDDDDAYLALRLAYHYDRKLNDKVLLFHNLEYLPGLDDLGNFQINTDIGLRTALTANMFSEFKFELRHDSQPAEGSKDNDLRYIFAIGWQF